MKQTTKTTKNFDAVAEMRAIREKLSERYWQKPDVLKSDLAEIRKKMGSVNAEQHQIVKAKQ